MIGHSDQANHQDDFADFFAAAASGNLPAVSFLPGAQVTDGHPGYSEPLAAQSYLVTVLNNLQQLPQWKNTAVFITWDDSDGWYDHVMPLMVNQSDDPARDGLVSVNSCGTADPLGGYKDRCGYGPRIPLLIISPYANSNFVLHSVNDASSMIRFSKTTGTWAASVVAPSTPARCLIPETGELVNNYSILGFAIGNGAVDEQNRVGTARPPWRALNSAWPRVWWGAGTNRSR